MSVSLVLRTVPGDQPGLRVSAESKVSVKAVDALIARVQRLIDSRPEAGDRLAWDVEAAYLADLPAIGALASIAARAPDEQILIVRELEASRNRVYAAWTTPELVKRWWGGERGEVMSAQIELRVGGTWRFVLVEKDGRRVAFHGEFREIVPNQRIVCTEIDERTQSETVNTVVFTDIDGRMRLALLMHFASAEARDVAISSGLETVAREQLNLLEQVVASLGG